MNDKLVKKPNKKRTVYSMAMNNKLKRKFQNKVVGLTDDHRDYIFGTDWKGYAKDLEKQLETLQGKYIKVLDMIIDLLVKYEPEKLQRRIDEITEFLDSKK